MAILQPVGDADVQTPSDIVELDFSRVGRTGKDFSSRGELFPQGYPGSDEDSEILEPDRTGSDESSGDEHAARSDRDSMVAHASTERIFDEPSFPLSGRYRLKPRLGSAADACRWVSHYNALAVPTYKSRSGEIFGTSHEIWRNLTEGDVIAVYARARFPGWQNRAKDGKLEFWEKFDPRQLADLSKGDN